MWQERLHNAFYTFVIVASLVGCVALAIWATGGSHQDPFYSHCNKVGGVVAQWHHGKTETEFCILHDTVVDTQGRQP